MPKKKFYKRWWFWVIIVVAIIAIAGSGGSDDKPNTNEPNAITQTTENTIENTTEKAIEYHKYDITQLFGDLKNNALKAQKTHEDEYVEITGYLSVIDASGDYISIGVAEGNYDYLFQTMQLRIKNDTQTSQIMNMSKGDQITVRCHITTVGEVLGYSADIIEIL